MKTKTVINLDAAVEQLLDALVNGKNITLDVGFDELNAGAIEQLMTALNEAARQRGIGVTIEPKEGNRLCLSLHRP